MTTFDLVDCYLFDYVSTRHLTMPTGSGCGCISMVEEMNEIRNMYYSNQPIQDVLRECVCRRHGHQYCIPNKAVDAVVEVLLKSTIPSTGNPFIDGGKIYDKFCDFEELYDYVRSVIGRIKGIGQLTIYDTAKRIGHLFDTPIYPKMYVYLAAGAKKGAENLILPMFPLKYREPIDLFKPYFGTLSSIFIEDMLCVFENELKTVSLTNLTLPTNITYPKVKNTSLVIITKNKNVPSI